jgi:hypothetical protein
MSLSQVLVNDMGRYLVGSLGWVRSLGSRYMSAVFSESGILPVSIMALMILVVIVIAVSPPYFNYSAKIPSGPAAFPQGSCLTSLLVSSCDHCSRFTGLYSGGVCAAYISDQYLLNLLRPRLLVTVVG